MNRRLFVTTVAGLATGAAGSYVVLEAVAGARLPERLRFRTGALPPNPIFERRSYRASRLRLSVVHRQLMGGLFARHGMRPVWFHLGEQLSYLIPFDSLAARIDAWTVLAADPEWGRLRDERETVSVSEITIYRMTRQV